MSLRLEKITKSFGNPPVEIIKGVSFELKDGEFVSLTGKSGSGKSTLLYMISTLDNPTSGRVFLQDQDITAMGSRELHRFRNRHMGFIFQYHYLLPEFTALENVLIPAIKAGNVSEKRSYAIELLESFDLKDRMHSVPGKLSGGESQRVAIARALIMNPEYVFADEPTGSLDSANAQNVMAIFQKINREHGCTIVYVTHDTEFATLAEKQIFLVDGQVKEIATKRRAPSRKR
jgi:lipoprotein-releasing system ATP-binding protein